MTQQPLLLALTTTQQSHLFYQTLSTQPIQQNVFAILAQTYQYQIDALLYWMNQLAIEIPESTYTPLKFGSHIVENLERSLIQEYQKIDFYNQILTTESRIEIRDLFYQFQATSYNQNLPLLRQALIMSYPNHHLNPPQGNATNDLEKGKEFLSQVEGIINDLKSGTLNEEKLGGFLGNINYSLLGGVVLGGISAMILNEFLNNQNKE